MEWQMLPNGTRAGWWDGQVIGQAARCVTGGGAAEFWLAYVRGPGGWRKVGVVWSDAVHAMGAVFDVAAADLDASVAEG